jgi:hypothetical protein
MQESAQLLTPGDMEQLRPAWKELCDLARRPDVAPDSKVRGALQKGVHSVEDLQPLAEAACEDFGAGRIGANLAQRAMGFVERVLARLRHRLDPLAGQLMLDEVGEELRKRGGEQDKDGPHRWEIARHGARAQGKGQRGDVALPAPPVYAGGSPRGLLMPIRRQPLPHEPDLSERCARLRERSRLLREQALTLLTLAGRACARAQEVREGFLVLLDEASRLRERRQQPGPAP